MIRKLSVQWLRSIDWVLLCSALVPIFAGLITMNSYSGENLYFEKQLLWFACSLVVFFVASYVDWRLLRRTNVIVILFFLSILVLGFLLFFGSTTRGVRGWLLFGPVSLQPIDFIRIVFIALLAKYFTRRHIEIARFKHLIISGIYGGIIAGLVLLQPDFGSVVILSFVWLGMVVVSGISKRHLALIGVIGALLFGGLWFFVFEPYQKARIVSFLNPLADIRGAGYNAYQSTIAVGSGEILGKGIGFGTQSRLQFLPAAHTDFIFAAFAEEWGFIGTFMLLVSFGVIIFRLLQNGYRGASNFESFFCIGLSILFTGHYLINIGMNVGLLPVTGVTLPFMSYGGSHLLSEFLAIGMVNGMRRYERLISKNSIGVEGDLF